jgi:hypothetical protein
MRPEPTRSSNQCRALRLVCGALWMVAAIGAMPVADSVARAAPPVMIEVESNKTIHHGKVVSSVGDQFWLMEQDGRIRELNVKSTSRFRQVSPTFQPLSPLHIGAIVRRDTGATYAVATTRHYVVAATSEAKARKYAEVLEDTYKAFHAYFSVRGLTLVEPECPLPAIVFADAGAFGAYAKKDQVPAARGMKGYYHPMTNRIALFEDNQIAAATPGDLASHPHRVFGLPGGKGETGSLGVALPSIGPVLGSIEAGLKDTLVHEATHQAAFNMGLHTRLGATPRWVCEGLATVFEAPGIRNSSANTSAKMRINPERMTWFGSYAQQRRKPKSLRGFLESDRSFDTHTLDAYSEAWALSFYLIEKRPREYAKYLSRISRRDALRTPTPEERVKDFEETISRDIHLVEAEVLRYVLSLNK